jgi:HEAT repeat protein
MGNFGDLRGLDKLMSGLENKVWNVQWGAAIGLEAMAQQAVDSLIQRIDQTEEPGQLARTIWLLDKLGDSAAIRSVILARGTAELALWQRTVAEAVEAGDRTVMELLIATLQHDNPRVRESAAEALGALGDRAAVIPLAGLLGDPDWQVRLAAASTLGRIGSSAVDLMVTTLREGDKKVRAGIADLLGILRAREAVDPLIQALDDAGRLVRANAAAALGSIGDPRAVRPLVHSMQDPDRGVRNNAATALRCIGTPEALAAVKEWTLARRQRASSVLSDEPAR